ncbi:Cif family virulence factor [Robertkochia flava]|uniref:nuclear transport factor 2 family protein n=1 Tax=Robertkochia flava TaxID=3447986 RepID=UPI001CCAD811|nr:nuclear transport factor 2 family protein [Robertkochia marina]
MKYTLLTTTFLLFCGFTQAQDTPEEMVKQTIIEFFEAFHKKDTAVLRTMAMDATPMETIGKDQEGNTVLRKSTYNDFLNRMAGMPEDMQFREELTDYMIRVDGDMANAWTPYRFWIDGELSHCGVNNFQLIKQGDGWKIFFVVDTRRKGDCFHE